MTIDTDKTLELLHNSPCGFSYDTDPSRYTIEQKELVKFVNFIYSKAIDDAMKFSANAICVGCGYLDKTKCKYKGGNCGVSKPMLEAVMSVLEQLKAGNINESN